MNKTLLLSLSLAAFAGLASAATINCIIVPTGNGTASGNTFLINSGNSAPGTLNGLVSCPGIDAGAGNIINSYQIIGTGDYTGGPIGTTTGTQVVLLYTGGAGPVSGATVTETVTGGNNSSGFNPATPFNFGAAQNPGTQTIAGQSINVSSTVTSGSVGASSGQFAINYTTQAVGGVPEPATLGLMGSALLGLGFLARRKK